MGGGQERYVCHTSDLASRWNLSRAAVLLHASLSPASREFVSFV